MKTLFPLIGVLLFSGCVFHPHPLAEQISQYRGDGEIKETSIASLLFSSPGFRLDFPKFDSASEFSTSYRISHLPVTKDGRPFIYLRFRSSVDARLLEDKFRGKIRYTIESCDGEVLFDKILVFKNAIWGESGDEFGLYDSSMGGFEFESSKAYLLRIQYSPEAKTFSFGHCYISIESGGYK